MCNVWSVQALQAFLQGIWVHSTVQEHAVTESYRYQATTSDLWGQSQPWIKREACDLICGPVLIWQH